MQAKEAFEKANPAIWNKVQNNPEFAFELRSLVERSAAIQEKMNLHIKGHRQDWIAREVLRVWEEQREELYPHPMPPWAGEAIGGKYIKEARQRVHHRIKKRHKQIRAITKKMQTTLTEKHTTYKPEHEKGYAKKEIAIKVHHTLERARELRKKARKQFKSTQKKSAFELCPKVVYE